MNTFIISENIRSRMFSDICKRLKNAEWIHIFVNHPIYRIISVNSVRDLKITTKKPGYLYHHCVQQLKDRNCSKNLSKIVIIFGIKRSKVWNIGKNLIPNRFNSDVCVSLLCLNRQFKKNSLIMTIQFSSGGIRND